jgi:uncharacterized cupredoxin-like copper-binding protein
MVAHGKRRAPTLIALAMVLAACGSSGGTASPTDQGPRTIQVRMTDALRFDPAEFTFRPGDTVRFEVANDGLIVHEFLIGDQAAQDQFEMQMSGGGMGHDSNAGVSVEPGQSETFEYTFADPGRLFAGCHEPGHYSGGMVAAITVEG